MVTVTDRKKLTYNSKICNATMTTVLVI